MRLGRSQYETLTFPTFCYSRDPKKGSLATLFAHLLAQLWSQTDTREVLTLFREQVGIRCPMYRSSDQQDSHEFLMSLLTVLHEDLNEAVGCLLLPSLRNMKRHLGEVPSPPSEKSIPNSVSPSSRKATPKLLSTTQISS